MQPDDVEVTEFTEIVPEEIHFVARGANGFPPLLAKSWAPAVVKDGRSLQTFAAVSEAKMAKAARLEAQALATSDPDLAAGLRARASKLRRSK